jgi:hypothetical protein
LYEVVLKPKEANLHNKNMIEQFGGLKGNIPYMDPNAPPKTGKLALFMANAEKIA